MFISLGLPPPSSGRLHSNQHPAGFRRRHGRFLLQPELDWGGDQARVQGCWDRPRDGAGWELAWIRCNHTLLARHRWATSTVQTGRHVKNDRAISRVCWPGSQLHVLLLYQKGEKILLFWCLNVWNFTDKVSQSSALNQPALLAKC